MIELSIGIHPDPLLVADAMNGAAAEIETDAGPMLSSLGHLMASIERAFIEQGPGWEPWSESYAMSEGSGHGPLLGQDSILIRTGELIGASQSPANYSVTNDEIEWIGTSTPDYTDYHLEGTSKMPERNFLVVDEAAQEAIDRDWTDWLDRIVGGVADISFRGRF